MTDKDTTRSSLWMVTKQPAINEFLTDLAEKKSLLEQSGLKGSLSFSYSQIEQVKEAFADMIRKGEAKLHRLCALLAEALLEEEYHLQSIVIGRLPEQKEKFRFSRPVSRDEILSRTDLDLGNWQLSRLRLCDQDGAWQQAELVANYVEYQPVTTNEAGILKMLSRIKAEEEVWAKVVDELFELDRLVLQDKTLRELSFFIKDVFGIKFVVQDGASVERLFERLKALSWDEKDLAKHRVAFSQKTQKLELIEVKNHLGEDRSKKSGWQAIKLVFQWWSKTFEIQIQAADVYFREQERLTQESHAAFKQKREMLRNKLGEQLPLFAFYTKLLKWLFIHPEEPAPQIDGLQVQIRKP